jgi:hypothetical protein
MIFTITITRKELKSFGFWLFCLVLATPISYCVMGTTYWLITDKVLFDDPKLGVKMAILSIISIATIYCIDISKRPKKILDIKQ